jgi:hypothetical protein
MDKPAQCENGHQDKLAVAPADVRRRSECLRGRGFKRMTLAASSPIAPRPATPAAPTKAERLSLLKEAAARAEAKLEQIRAEMEAATK